MLIPGYTTFGTVLILGKLALKTRLENLELDRITSDCRVVVSSHQSIGYLYTRFNKGGLGRLAGSSINTPSANNLSGK